MTEPLAPRLHFSHAPPPKVAPIPVPGPRARIMAFRVPMQYAIDAIIGYQGLDSSFKVYGYAGPNLPEGWKLWQQGAWCEHVRGGGLYVIIEHPSFPEHELGSGIIPEFTFTIGERDVVAVLSKVKRSQSKNK